MSSVTTPTKNTAPAPAAAPARVTVILAGKHTHRGRDFARGDKLELLPEQAEWLIAKGRAAREGQSLPAEPGAIKTLQTMDEVDAALAAAVISKR